LPGFVKIPHVLGLTRAPAAPSRRSDLDVCAIHEAHAGFVWLTLQRLGIRDADVEDMLQEVFVVVHRKLQTFDGTSRMTTWLFGICMRVASAYRRRAYVRRERAVADVPESASDAGRGPEEVAEQRQAQARLAAVLDEMDLEKRAVFVMFEIDEIPCEEIATIMGVPVGTVHSRLFTARKAFRASLARLEAREASAARMRRGGR